jgi:hypothetical protein
MRQSAIAGGRSNGNRPASLLSRNTAALGARKSPATLGDSDHGRYWKTSHAEPAAPQVNDPGMEWRPRAFAGPGGVMYWLGLIFATEL